jgi:DNA modification methylase
MAGQPVDPAVRRIEYLPLDELTAAPRNPKRHSLELLRASIGRFGFATPALRDERTGRLVVGHGRSEALRGMRDAGETAPAGVQVDDTGRWLVPVVCGWASRSDAEAEAYLVADNRHTELGGWDNQELADLLADVQAFDPELIEATGWDLADLDALLADEATDLPPALSDPDDVPDVPAEPVSKPGDVWLLGKHRVLCGDSTDVAAVEAMLAGDRADCMWTDPPYGVDYVGGTKDALTIENDGADGLPELLAGAFAVATAALNLGAPVYVAHPEVGRVTFEQAMLAAGWLVRQNLIWVKGSLVLGRKDYHWRHEPILYGFTDGGIGKLGRGGDRWYGDDSQTTVFEVPKPPRSEVHPTMKPVELIVAMIVNSCPSGGLVYEPFGGSGSALMAANQLGMRAAVVELDPRYVDVICRRWQEHTGDKPVLAATGQPHDFTQ